MKMTFVSICLLVSQFLRGCKAPHVGTVEAGNAVTQSPTEDLAKQAPAPTENSHFAVVWHRSIGVADDQFGKCIRLVETHGAGDSIGFAVAVAAPGDGLREMGSVYLLNDSDGSSIEVKFDNDTPFRVHAFGYSMSDTLDFDGDGLSEIIVADPPSMRGMNVMSTRLHLLGTRTLDVIAKQEFSGPAGLGFSVIRVPDFNGDGLDELAMAATFVDPNVVQLRDGKNWSLLREWTAPFSRNWIDFGYSMCGLGDGSRWPPMIVVAAAPPSALGGLYLLRADSGVVSEIPLPACAGEPCRVVAVEALRADDARQGRERFVVSRLVESGQLAGACAEIICLDYGLGESTQSCNVAWRWSNSSRGSFEEDSIAIAELVDLTGDGRHELAVAYVDSEGLARLVVLNGRDGSILCKPSEIRLGYGGGFGLASRADSGRCFIYFARSENADLRDDVRLRGIWKIAIPRTFE